LVSSGKTEKLIGLSLTEIPDKSLLDLVVGTGRIFVCEAFNCRSASTQSFLLT